MRWRGLSALLLCALLPRAAAAQDQSAAQTFGKAIYERGAGLMPMVAGRPRPALVGRMTCAGCHGTDGLGGTEGGAARAPAISWQALTQATEGRPAYDTTALAVAVRAGVSTNGQALRMPQFDISDMQLAALTEHLQWLDRIEREGLGPNDIVVRLPAGTAAARAVAAAMASFNAEGGAYGRQIVPGEAAFLDLGQLLKDLRPALTIAEVELAQSYLATAPGWEAESRRDSQAALILRNGPEQAVILPVAASLDWAQANGADLEGARIHAMTLLILEEFRRAGRSVTRTDFGGRAARIDLRPALVIQHQPTAR